MIRKNVAIDLGTANTLVWVVGEGLVVNEPTVVAISAEDSKVVAVGEEAKKMLGRTPEALIASRPMRDGVIADYQVTEAMLRYFIGKVLGRFQLFKPNVMVCVPAGCTQVERRAALDATLSAGAGHAYLIDEPLAAAIGAQIPVSAPSGHMIIDIGGGSTEAAVISLGGVVTHKSVRVAGNKIDEGIQSYLKKKHNLIVGDTTAEDIKLKIGSAISTSKAEKLEISGRDLVFGLPRTVIITSSEVTEAIKPVLMQIIGAVKGVLEDTPPELAADIIDKGIIMSGGSALLRNFDKLITEETGVPAHVADEPLLCVVRGTGLVLENIELWKRSVTTKG
ncbi:MAG: cell shape determining protein, MreB/Mrl family, rod shape-determining protein MreB [Microgenomates group bacterium GW2011_GWC1_43_13]|uniref:Cell shape-determining protein MreB n=3 Tax=Candidatus Woeseibacteriota TaxID=1752722 RepID=A0A837IBQ6_9BACT|nr:MAG: cell shape determining protein, MreB/Mrl family, rod shape-determining protein MreB [Microgenomates group bacterium GW2011_GWC1_43_13]KKT33187.1 MAG: Cell shape determining protein, MreB/Mrl family [Candidatus Woesebacteria bacterium GW2011_GWB1_44_11]KKT54475.1 MAG: Cell shape determining protein, MreB/Mrl family [Candidatus Woesebacteria bacterium GW2011_GWA1_44_23]OGM75880.1 MAG: rod shape-determining protein [Candidatus Woesebacteria bacterium RIFOXYA1_FULL_43_16]OGM83380.1 MAG: rod